MDWLTGALLTLAVGALLVLGIIALMLLVVAISESDK